MACLAVIGVHVLVTTFVLAGPTSTAEPGTAAPEPFWREVWIGADATTSSWLVYSGITLSPLSGIHDDGPRLRFATGYGGYRWKGTARTTEGEIARGAGTTFYADILAGYLKRFGPLTAKAFAGVSLSGHSVTSHFQPFDVPVAPNETPIDGREIGVKAALEFWLNIGTRGWSSLDLNWTSAHDTYSARFRAAWRAWPTVSFGGEAIVNGDQRHDISEFMSEPGLEHIERRLGAFARYEWYGGEVSLAGGIASAPDDGGTKPYATINWITQF